MFYVIICEGKTDSIVINHFMTSQNFKYEKDSSKYLKFNTINKQTVDYFKNGSDVLAIWNVDGCGNIKSSIGQVESLITVGSDVIDSLAIVTDMDFNLSQDIEKEISSYFSRPITLADNVWSKYNYQDSFGSQKSLKTLLTIIPHGQSGALETIMLGALENSGNEEKLLVSEVNNFIDDLETKNLRFLDKNRKIIKSKLGCTVNIIDPERTFFDIRAVFDSISWGNYPVIQNHFYELKNYK